MMQNIMFIFNLDGTVTTDETLLLIANSFNLKSEMDVLLEQAVTNNLTFIESFIKKVNLLGRLPVSKISDLLSEVKLYSKIHNFMKQNNNNCIIATGNLDCWIRKLINRVGCKCFYSAAEVVNDNIKKITTILKKESIVRFYQQQGMTVIFIGNGNNDLEAMRISDISIACGVTNRPAGSVLSIADYLVFSEDSLCRLTNQLLSAAPE